MPAPSGFQLGVTAASPVAVSQVDKVRALGMPSTYPEHPSGIETIETHMAWVFLTDRLAYKMKKPVQYAFLDFSTLERRYRTCCDEVRLNRRLASDVYLGVVPLVRASSGDLRVEGSGVVVEWLVKMRRLPGERMLDRVLATGSLDQNDLQRVATLLAGFYRTAVRPPMNRITYERRLRHDVEENHMALCEPSFGLPSRLVASVAEEQLRFIDRHARLWRSRVDGGRIVEGHGDLRPEHICLGPPLAIIDCIEFNPDFRVLDAADELAFLTLEAGRLGAPHVRATLFDTYRRDCGDDSPEQLIEFYMSFRSLLRAKIAAWHIPEPGAHHPDTWRRRALDYLHRASHHVDRAS